MYVNNILYFQSTHHFSQQVEFAVENDVTVFVVKQNLVREWKLYAETCIPIQQTLPFENSVVLTGI
jgi:hypothetical protein